MMKCDRGLESSIFESQFFIIRTEPKPANNLFTFFLQLIGFQVSLRIFVIELAGLTRRLRAIVKYLTCERASKLDTRQRKMY